MAQYFEWLGLNAFAIGRIALGPISLFEESKCILDTVRGYYTEYSLARKWGICTHSMERGTYLCNMAHHHPVVHRTYLLALVEVLEPRVDDMDDAFHQIVLDAFQDQ